MKFSIHSTVRTYPRVPYETMKNAVLGKNYELTLTFIGVTRAQNLNITHRNKNYVPNILSFPLTTAFGEILITPAIAKIEAKKFNMTERGYIGYLFIHACLHLKGLNHGGVMDKAEKKFIKQFHLK